MTEPYYPTSPEPPVPPTPKGPRLTARHALIVVFLAALLLVLFEGSSIRSAGEEMDPGLERDLVLAVGEPAGWLADRIPFDEWTDDALAVLEDVEAGITVDLFLSYRAIRAWHEMIRLAARMPRPLAETVMVREQLGFALNRAGRGEEAEEVLLGVLEQRGPSSETYGLLGRVYKDRWAAERSHSRARARGFLRQAVDAYRAGFEADWRDAYPGVNAVTLMEILEPGGREQQRLVPVVRYAAERRVADGRADYWDHATRLELAVIARSAEDAEEAASDALAAVREPWEPESTANNLRLIREARAEAGEKLDWADGIEEELLRTASLTAT